MRKGHRPLPPQSSSFPELSAGSPALSLPDAPQTDEKHVWGGSSGGRVFKGEKPKFSMDYFIEEIPPHSAQLNISSNTFWPWQNNPWVLRSVELSLSLWQWRWWHLLTCHSISPNPATTHRCTLTESFEKDYLLNHTLVRLLNFLLSVHFLRKSSFSKNPAKLFSKNPPSSIWITPDI